MSKRVVNLILEIVLSEDDLSPSFSVTANKVFEILSGARREGLRNFSVRVDDERSKRRDKLIEEYARREHKEAKRARREGRVAVPSTSGLARRAALMADAVLEVMRTPISEVPDLMAVTGETLYNEFSDEPRSKSKAALAFSKLNADEQSRWNQIAAAARHVANNPPGAERKKRAE